jgi:tetratricopeptide (TPR) repeat protein
MTSPERPRPIALATWIAILLLALWLVFVGGGWQGIHTTALRLASVVLAGAGLAAWAVAAMLRPAWRPASMLLPAWVAALFSLGVSTAASRYPRVSVEYLAYAIILGALYLLLVRLLAQPFFRARLGALAVGLCLVVSLAFLVLVVEHWIDWWALVGRITVPPLRPDFEGLTFGNPSAVLTMAVLTLCPAVAHLGGSAAGRRVAAGLAIGVALVIVLSGSRAGWLAIALAIAIVGGAWLLTDGRSAARTFASAVLRQGPARLVTIAGGAMVAFAAVALAPAVLRRLTEGGEDLRAGYIAAAVRMSGEAPLLGTGPGTWVVQRIRYTLPTEVDYYIPHAHDVPAQTAAELGMVGSVAGVVLLASLAWLIRDALRDGDAARRRWGWAAAFSLVYFGAHQLFDFYLNMPAFLFAAALPLAWLDATAVRRPRIAGRLLPTSLGRWPALGATALVGIAVAVAVWVEIPAARHAEAVRLANGGEWAAGDAPARAAAALDPGLPPYLLTEGLTAARAGDHERAATAFRRSVLLDDLPEAWLDLAAAEAALGRAAAASEALERAVRLGLQRPAVAMAAGDLAQRIGERELALKAYTRALVAAPSLAGDPWWLEEPDRAALFAEARDEAIRIAGPPRDWEIALMSGDVRQARLLAGGFAYPSGLTAAQVIDAWSGDRDAHEAVLQRCAARPLDLTGLAWCARLEGRVGRVQEANRYRAWSNTVVGGSYAAGAELRVRRGPQVGRSDAGDPARFYGHYTYRRPTPWDLLVPDLIHLALE